MCWKRVPPLYRFLAPLERGGEQQLTGGQCRPVPLFSSKPPLCQGFCPPQRGEERVGGGGSGLKDRFYLVQEHGAVVYL